MEPVSPSVGGQQMEGRRSTHKDDGNLGNPVSASHASPRRVTAESERGWPWSDDADERRSARARDEGWLGPRECVVYAHCRSLWNKRWNRKRAREQERASGEGLAAVAKVAKSLSNPSEW